MRKIAFLIPAYNEEEVIAHTIKSLLNLADKADIYVVDDGSRDQTARRANRYISNILRIENSGKASAINKAVRFFNLTKRYKYIMPVDADTVLSPNLARIVLPIFQRDDDKKIAAVICKVRGRSSGVFTIFRMWEYEISQVIHKSAQGVINSISVCPGCSTVYRAEVFEKETFPSNTTTEDMDLTFTIHRKKLGKIVFTQKAEVVTQDPKNLREYTKQIYRWYTGFWQCVAHHKIPWGGQVFDLEISLLATEGVFNGLLSLFFLFAIPAFLVSNPKILAYPFLFDLFLFTLPTLIYMARKFKSKKIFLYIPHFYILRIFNSLVFFISFLGVILGLDRKEIFIWNTARYKPRKEDSWEVVFR